MNTPSPKRTRFTLIVLVALALAACQDAPEGGDAAPAGEEAALGGGAATAEQDGWIELFDGETLDGWTQENGTATYRVEDGAVVGRTAEGSPNSFLVTEDTYGDFELEFETRLIDPQLNSGVQIRSRTKGQDADDPGRVFGPQVEIEASGEEGGEAGYIYGEATGRGWLIPDDERTPHTVFDDDGWNQYRIVADGPRIRTWINGEPVADLTDEEIYETHPEGFIGLQVHGIPEGAGPYEVRWRNIRLRELGR